MRSKRLTCRVIATCASVAVAVVGLVAVPTTALAANVEGSGPITSGIAGKCLDEYGPAINGAVVDLWDCNGSPVQNWQVESDGTLQINGKCLDIIGNSTANGTYVDLWDCNGLGGQQWRQEGDTIVNPQSGRCLDDPGGWSNNGNRIRIWDCNNAPAQQWTLPGGVTDPGGDLWYSVYVPGVSASVANEVISTLWPQSVGGSGSDSLSNLMYDAWARSVGSNPGEPQPPSFSGGYIYVSESDPGGVTFTANVPAADFQANISIPDWVASIISSITAIAASMASYALCVMFFSLPLAAFVPNLCGGVSTFFWVFVGTVMKDYLTGTPYDWGSIFASSLTYALGAVTFPWVTAWMHDTFPGTVAAIATAIRNGLVAIKNWLGRNWQNAVDAIRQAMNNARDGAPNEVIELASEQGKAVPTETGQISSGIAGKCVDNNGGFAINGNKVQLWDCNGFAPAQNWTLYSNGNLTIDGMCLDIIGNSTANGTYVDLWECNGVGGQVWQQIQSSGHFGFENPQSGLCLDDPGGYTTNGTQLRIWSCNGQPAQQWQILALLN